MWVGSEKVLSAIWPAFGTHRRAFDEAVKNGDEFTADTSALLTHIVLGVLLLAIGLLKLVMSWPYVPIWYHVIFTAILLPMTVIGGKLKTTLRERGK